ncbi:hypothetical protein BI344_16445 [Chromobacterium sphagni]|uniref:Uncharacterized protein n=1 Tax=Chromobacterium sphagni TaxID=1903179 RepID=A0ABX3CC98_9NEIS|nr:hypothetical protein [Chromobacterium sphagni]OHX19836.1 hypothetical protein BI344_16445 [Chromobacterium sphagni]
MMAALARRFAGTLLIALALLAGFTLWQQRDQLQRQAAELATATQDSARLATLNQLQAEQLAAQAIDIKLQAAASRELAEQVAALSRKHAAAAAKLEAAIHATPAAAAWGSAAIPADLARLFDTTAPAGAAPAAAATLPGGDGLSAAGAGANHQPATGRQLAAAPGGA